MENITVQTVFDEMARAEYARREMTVTGPINEDQAHTLAWKLRYMTALNHEPITIYMNTPGGSIADGLAIYDEILKARETTPIKIVCTGACMSMGVIILQAATDRLSYRNTSFLLHELAMAVAGGLGVQKDAHSRALKLQNLLNGILTGRSKLNDKSLEKLMSRQDRYLDAAEMRKYGLLDSII